MYIFNYSINCSIFIYLFFNVGLACVIPYLPVHAKEIGISAISVGVVYCILPVFTMIVKPLFGFIADHFDVSKSLMTVFLGVIMLSSSSTVSIPRKHTMINSVIHCSPSGTDLFFKAKPNTACSLDTLNNKTLKCYMHCSECVTFANITAKNSSLEKVCREKVAHRAEVTTVLERSNSSYSFSVQDIDLSDRKMNTVCFVNLTFTCKAFCEPMLQECLIGKEEPEYSSEQFSLFLIFATLCVSVCSVATSFSDAICFNELEENAHLYGKQRLWGTVGWGLLSPVAGYLNEALSGDSFLKAYQPGAILQIIILMYDLYIVSKLKTKNMKYSQNICKDIGKLLQSFKMLAFLMGVFVVGSFTAILWSFLYWYLGNIGGKSKILFGLIPAVQCFAGELPYFFFAGTLISKLGHFNILTVNFIMFGIRFIGYSFLSNPWLVLPIELLQGPTYGLFYANMASFANVAALPGTETTVQGLVGSAFEFGKLNYFDIFFFVVA